MPSLERMGRDLNTIFGFPAPTHHQPRKIRTHGSKPHRGLCLHFYTYGQHLRSEPALTLPIIIRVNCVRLKPPPTHVCEGHTGLDVRVADSFFSYHKNEQYFQEALDQVQHFLDKHDDHVGCVAIVVSCYYGVHRSVAMAERMATVVERWTGLSVYVRHLDVGERIERQRRAREQRETLGIMAKYLPRVVRWFFGE